MIYSAGSLFRVVILETPASLWISTLVLLVRIATLSLIFRSFLFPWLLSHLLKRVRVRSVSLRSIRGLYIRAGPRVIRIDRVRYGFSRQKGLNVRLDGLNIDLGKVWSKPSRPTARGPNRRLTLADFGPSPVARRLWNLLSYAYSLAEPSLRPIIRTCVVAGLRLLIRWLPHIISGLNFEAHSSTLTLSNLPATSVSAEKLTFHVNLSFTDLESVIDTAKHSEMPRLKKLRRSYGMAAWRKRFVASFQRSLDRAWGKAQGNASIAMNVYNIIGSTQSSVQPTEDENVQFVRLPGAIDLGASMGFSPRRGTADTHSLVVSVNIGDCFLGLDTFKLLLQNLKFNEPTSTSFPLRSNFELSVAIPDPPDSESSFLAQSSTVSPGTASPPESAWLSPDILTSLPPSSPFFEALSASIRSRRRQTYQPCMRLKDIKKTSALSVLKHVGVHISSVTLTTERKWGQDPYELKVQKIALNCSICDEGSPNALHQRWLGRNRDVQSYDPDAYSLTFSIHQIFIERRTKLDSMRLFTLATVDIHVLATQWPVPWLQPSPFLAGDPNEPFLALQGRIGGIEIVERLERLRELIAHMEPSVKTKDSTHKIVPTPTLDLPRLAFELECGTIRGRIICANTENSEPFAVELRNNGFVVSAVTSYTRDHRANGSHQGPDEEKNHLFRMDYNIHILLQPTLTRLRSRMETDLRLLIDLRSFDADFLNDPSLLSLETLSFCGNGHAIASMVDDVDTAARVIKSSFLLDLHLSSETMYVEVWNPLVVMAIHQLLSLVPIRDDDASTPSSKGPLLDSLPTGFSMSVTIARFVVFVAAPDINPDDSLDLSRGFACQTGLSIQYSSMHSGHTHRFPDLPHRTQTRQKLYLPQEHIVDAVSAARASAITHNASAHVRILLWDLAFRSSVATRYDADDPCIFEQHDRTFDRQQFLHIPSVQIALHFVGKRGPAAPRTRDVCEISVVVPSVALTLQLAYVYSTMLAAQTIKSLLPPSTSRQASHHPSTMRLTYRVKVSVSTFQVLCPLRTQKCAARVNGIEVDAYPGSHPSARFDKLFIWVCLPSRISGWEVSHGDKWEEFFNLQSLHARLSSAGANQTMSLEGESSRLRIPFGFVLSDLITDITITAKAIRHLALMARKGRYSPMQKPGPEAPKVVPRVTIRLEHLCVEAADDKLEGKLAVIWRCGREAIKQRIEREEAFQAKVAAIYQAESDIPRSGTTDVEQSYHFGATHTVSVEEARRRLDGVHELDWTLRLQEISQRQSRLRDALDQNRQAKNNKRRVGAIPNIVEVTPEEQHPPLFRALLSGLLLRLQQPSFPPENLADFLFKQGNGLPYETQFYLLAPLHLHFTLSSLHITLRDYPLPLASIPPNLDHAPVLEFNTDLVIAEEMGTDLSVDWIDCPIIEAHHGILGSSELTIAVPKTIMPVKTYANPVVHIMTSSATIFSWGVSYTPAIQDLMRVIETLSTAPRDASPSVGFWDKIRLVFHWSLVATFKEEVRFHMKGSRDPHKLSDDGAGFVLSWQGNTQLLVAQKNEDKELIQVISDSMYIAIPNLQHLYPHNQTYISARHIPETTKPFRKICAKLRSGVRFGVGLVLERACGNECLKCSGSAFHRKCRNFHFLPHYNVRLEKKSEIPIIKSSEDSYNGFRSDFIHLSISLASPTRTVVPGSNLLPSSIHLTPKTFTHFWSWCALFDSTLSLPTRQGSYYPPRIVSPKFGRHLATLKYRLNIRNLFVMHGYMDESRETWVDGVIPWVGVKGLIEELQADMHQRDEESIVPGLFPNTEKVLRRKPVYAAEVSLKGLDLRMLLATFKEPLRKAVEMIAPSQRGNYRTHQNLPVTPSASVWYDSSDFVEIDWSPSVEPKLHLLSVATCPHFAYFKRNSVVPPNSRVVSKFGLEGSHPCFLGQALPVPQVQIEITEHRIEELRRLIRSKRSTGADDSRAPLERMVTLLEEYVSHLRSRDSTQDATIQTSDRIYLMPTFTLSPDEWDEFENVYHVHCPKLFMDSAIRDIILQYYYCSRDRKGLEYRMATRAVKFIRDQAEAALGDESDSEEGTKSWGATATAHMAASALKKMLKGETAKPSVEIISGKSHDAQSLEEFNPLQGWSEGVSLRKSHCCLLLKPQIVLRGEGSKDALAVAAVQAKLQTFAVMDDSNADDPISGKVMSRSHTALSGLQTFAPASLVSKDTLYVPLEVLIDLRCESNSFDQLVPQTDATFQYDKFNRLRLRNNITSVARSGTDKSSTFRDSHLQDQTDLIRVHIPRFTVSANDEHFQAISHIVTKLLLFSDAAHKTRLEKLETLLFTYDFTDLTAAAKVVANLQDKLLDAIEAQRTAEYNHSRRLETEEGQLELLKLKAHIFLLSEELNYLFDAIKLAQDRYDDQSDQKSALLLHASSSEISWRMLDERRGLLSKLVVQNINFYWLSRQDSSTSNNVAVSDLQAFDGSRHATWTEILSKHDEPANHALLKRGLFLLASWTILAPVGGITIYESFELSLHPMRLQIDARVGQRIMEYLWPARKERRVINEATGNTSISTVATTNQRMSIDSPRALHGPGPTLEPGRGELALRTLGSSRSFTDLRGSLGVPVIHKMPSSEAFRQLMTPADGSDKRKGKHKGDGDAAEMKTRTSQKSFVLVKVSSLDLLLSIVKEGSFECHDARIKTRELVYRNQTLSFEELVNQFVPSDMSWKGWVKMAFHQPLLPVLPVARELISKTKLISSKSVTHVDIKGTPPRLPRAKVLSGDDETRLALFHSSKSSKGKGKSVTGWKKTLRRKDDTPVANITSLPLTDEPESVHEEEATSFTRRKRMVSLLNRGPMKGSPAGSSTTVRPSKEE